MAKEQPQEFKCYKCGHEWAYKGKSKYYLSCPHCYSKLNIKRLTKEVQANDAATRRTT